MDQAYIFSLTLGLINSEFFWGYFSIIKHDILGDLTFSFLKICLKDPQTNKRGIFGDKFQGPREIFFMIYFDIFENSFQEPNVNIVGNIFKYDFRDSMIFRLINVDFDGNFQGPCLDFFYGTTD